MKIKDLVQNVNELTTDDVLHMLGLQRRGEQVLPMIGMFSVGLLVGAGVGLLFAPKAGREIRRGILTRMNELRERGVSAAREAGAKVTEAMKESREHPSYGSEDVGPGTAH